MQETCPDVEVVLLYEAKLEGATVKASCPPVVPAVGFRSNTVSSGGH